MLRTEYDFTLPRGYVDLQGTLHRTGRMRLATARDELEPLRDPTVQGADDPRLTILVLSRVITALGSLELVNSATIEGLFAVDLAFLQDFYGVINFGDQDEFDALVAASESSTLLGVADSRAPEAGTDSEEAAVPEAAASDEQVPAAESSASEDRGPVRSSVEYPARATTRHTVEELPRRSG